MEKNFRFWMPLNLIEKGGEDGNKKLKVGGIASTSKKDLDGEVLDPNGFDLSYFKNKGIVNWNHNKSPDAIIGEPTDVKLTKEGLYVEAELYPDNPLAKSVYSLAETLQKSSKTRRLGFSIEGKAIERDDNDKTKVNKALITNIALTISPKNPDSIVNIVKGNFNELSDEDLKPYDYEFDAEIEQDKLGKLQKAFSTSESGKQVMKESVEGNLKNQIDNDEDEDVKKSKTLTKGEVIDRLMKDNSVITFEKANQIVEILNNIEMAKETKTNITDETLEKALGVLGLNQSAEDDLTKGVDDTDDMDDDGDGDNEEAESNDEKEAEKKKKPSSEDGNNLKKSIDLLATENIEMFKGVGTLLKGIYDVVTDNAEEVKQLREENAELRKSIEEMGEQPAGGRKSSARPLNKSFEKGLGGNDEQPLNSNNVMSISQNKPQVLSLLDNMAFEKGFNTEIAKAMTTYESSGVLSNEVAQMIKQEKGVILVK